MMNVLNTTPQKVTTVLSRSSGQLIKQQRVRRLYRQPPTVSLSKKDEDIQYQADKVQRLFSKAEGNSPVKADSPKARESKQMRSPSKSDSNPLVLRGAFSWNPFRRKMEERQASIEREKGLLKERKIERIKRLVATQKKEGLLILTEKPEKKDVLVVVGAGANISYDLAEEWLKRGPERSVLFLCRKLPSEEEQKRFQGRIQFAVADKREFGSEEVMTHIINEALDRFQSPIGRLALVSCKGSSNPPKGDSYRDINTLPVIQSAKAVANLAHRADAIALLNISSISASYFPSGMCGYIDARKEADEAINQIAEEARVHNPHLKVATGIAIRPGMIYGPLAESQDWCFAQLAGLPIQPLPGSGEQRIPSVSVRDLVTVVVNALSGDEMHGVVDVVSDRDLTLRETYEHFYKARYVSIPPCTLKVPLEVVKAMASTIPFGRLAKYSGEMLALMDGPNIPKLDGSRFRLLLDKTPDNLRDVYPFDHPPIFVPTPPLREHLISAIKQLKDHPQRIFKLVKVIMKYLPELMKNMMETMRKAQKVTQETSDDSDLEIVSNTNREKE